MDWTTIRKDYEASDSTPKELAAKYGVKVATLRSRKSREHWHRSGDAPPKNGKRNGVATKQKNVATHRNVATALHVIDISNLTEKQKLFCAYYLQRYNATWAYQKAYGTRHDVAKTNGSRLLTNANVKELIEQLKRQQQADLYLTADDILREYAKQAFASLGDVMDYRVHEEMATDSEGMPRLDTDDNPITRHVTDIFLKPSDEIDWSVIQDIHTGKDGLVVKLHDNQKAMRELLDRLPEPIDTDIENDSFLGAIGKAIKHKKHEDGGDGEN